MPISMNFFFFFSILLYEVLELRTGDSVRDAIHVLYEKDVFGAPIADVLDLDESTSATRRFSDNYIGFIDFASMVLWCLEVICFSTILHLQSAMYCTQWKPKHFFYTMVFCRNWKWKKGIQMEMEVKRLRRMVSSAC